MDPLKAAEAIKKQSRKEIVLPSLGVPVIIGKVYPGDFVNAGLDFPARLEDYEAPEGATEEEKAAILKKKQAGFLSENPGRMVKLQAAVLEAGFICPELVISQKNEVGPGQIHIRDIADDYYWVINQIMEFSGLGKAGRAVQTFRKGESEGPVDA